MGKVWQNAIGVYYQAGGMGVSGEEQAEEV